MNFMSNKESQFRTKRHPKKPPRDPLPETQEPGIWESFRGGLNSGLGVKYDDWLDMRLSPQEWLAKYPGKTIDDWKYWKEQQEKKTNWLQRVFRTKLW